MTKVRNLPDRGYTNPQRLLPEGGGVEEVRRALNRVYDQLDRVADDSGLVREAIQPEAPPYSAGGSITTVGIGDGGIGGGGTGTGGGTTGSGGTGGGTTLPVTIHIPRNNTGVLTIDANGYVDLQAVTV